MLKAKLYILLSALWYSQVLLDKARRSLEYKIILADNLLGVLDDIDTNIDLAEEHTALMEKWSESL